MIINASVKTDIPAFYGAWFMNRIDAGFCLATNRFNRKNRIALTRDEVDGFFFWTKNVGPFMPQLEILTERGYPFVVHYTITGYPRAIEPAVLPADRAIEQMRILREKYGPRAAVWRYDPIAITSLTDFDFHRLNFRRLAERLAATTDEVCVSFVNYYPRMKRERDEAARQRGFEWEDPTADRKREFIVELNGIAREHNLKLSLCAQREYLSPGINDAACVDVQRLSDVAGVEVHGRKPGHRGSVCGCFHAVDIGAYNTCRHGCAYCYAVQNNGKACDFFRRHDPAAENLSDGFDDDGEAGVLDVPDCQLAS